MNINTLTNDSQFIIKRNFYIQARPRHISFSNLPISLQQVSPKSNFQQQSAYFSELKTNLWQKKVSGQGKKQ